MRSKSHAEVRLQTESQRDGELYCFVTRTTEKVTL